uniref:Potassium channel domain-containing protein n=1 Tax=Trichuris muris TaxID=70415 RepID=A0A5S6Q370_TRIMR
MTRFCRACWNGFKWFCLKVISLLFSHIGLCSLVASYAAMGAAVFRAIEFPFEQQVQGHMRNDTEQIMRELLKFTKEQAVLNPREWMELADGLLKDYETKLVHAVNFEGYDGEDEQIKYQWTFFGALLYSITIFTTIGYGHICPKTRLGRAITILYAMIGIPLMLLCLANIADSLVRLFTFIYSRICCFYCRMKKQERWMKRANISVRYTNTVPRFNPCKAVANASLRQCSTYPSFLDGKKGGSLRSKPTEFLSIDSSAAPLPKIVITNNSGETDVQWNLSEDDEIVGTAERSRETDARFDYRRYEDTAGKVPKRLVNHYNYEKVPVSIGILTVVLFILGGAVLFAVWENWNVFDGAYFSFVTLTTIGFGDMVPGKSLDSGSQEKLIICSLYLLFGMALIAMCFKLMQDDVVEKTRWLGERIGLLVRQDPYFEEESDLEEEEEEMNGAPNCDLEATQDRKNLSNCLTVQAAEQSSRSDLETFSIDNALEQLRMPHA